MLQRLRISLAHEPPWMTGCTGSPTPQMFRFDLASVRAIRVMTGVAIMLGVVLQGCAATRPVRGILSRAQAGFHPDLVSIPSKSGSTLRAWFVRGKPGGGAVVLLHGVGSDKRSMLARAAFLAENGYTVLAPDFQGQGESPGEPPTYGARESRDAEAAVAFVRLAAPDERVGVIGVSMGGAAAVLGEKPLEASALVLESVYPTIEDAVSDRLETWFGPFGEWGRSLAPSVWGLLSARLGVDESALQPIARIGAVIAPVMIVTGADDPYTPLPEAEALYARVNSPKAFWAVPGAKHEDLHAFAPQEYERRVGEFLATYLRR
jgi:fermentation-respiration switch protein FrsA (DUF1100 family)